MVGDFKSRFTENIQNVGKLLEKDGYNVKLYNAALKDAEGYKFSTHSKDPLKALETTLKDISQENIFAAKISGTKLDLAYNGELNPETLINSLMRGAIEIQEPKTNIASTKKNETNKKNLLPAYNIVISYRPNYPNDYWVVKATSPQEPYTQKDAKKKVQEITKTLRQNGVKVKETKVN